MPQMGFVSEMEWVGGERVWVYIERVRESWCEIEEE